MALKSLKKSPDEARIPSPAVTGPSYGWGLRIDLDDETLKTLGFVNLPKVGDRITIKAVGRVVAAREDMEEGKRSLEVQLTDMDAQARGAFEDLSEDD